MQETGGSSRWLCSRNKWEVNNTRAYPDGVGNKYTVVPEQTPQELDCYHGYRIWFSQAENMTDSEKILCDMH